MPSGLHREGHSKTKFLSMRRSLSFSTALLAAILFSFSALAQNVIITGNVKNTTTSENLPAISVTVKGGTEGTFTDAAGNFRLGVSRLPVVLVVSSVGFEAREVTVDNAASPVQVSLLPSNALGQEVVVSATRSAQRILDAPVTVERMNSAVLRNAPTPSYYEAIANLKGVDMHTASLTFRTITTRGFVASGNTRLNQLIDGMDNQAPGLNFAVGSVIGLTELDVDNIELLSGASSALYGSGGVNGTLLINSKNPFRHQGLSFQVKQGIMHLNSPSGQSPSPYYDWSLRWAKPIGDRFAFKIAAQFIKANDWQAYDYDNVERNSIASKVVEGNRNTDPNYDGVNVYGDETSANMRFIAGALVEGARQQFVAGFRANFGVDPTLAQQQAWLASTANPTQLYYRGLNDGLIPNQNVSRTGYIENDLVDYNTQNLKLTGGLHYKITPGIEASWNSYFGAGTTVYTGADRYSLRNLKMSQHKLEIRAANWFVRGYTTQENAGDSYNATILGRLINEAWKPSLDAANPAGSWYPQYIGAYLTHQYNAIAGTGQPGGAYSAHNFARGIADQGRPLPGSADFNSFKQNIQTTPIPNGALFLDRSDLWAAEAQLNISDLLQFSDKVEMIGGSDWKQYVLNSQGTIFADTTGIIRINSIGGYLQLRKKFLNDVLTLTAAGRYDKMDRFDGRFTPRFTAVVRVAPNNNVRFSYQTAYRFPTNQDQYINLATASGLLIGGFPEFQDYYGLTDNPAYTAESVTDYRNGGDPTNTSILQEYQFQEMKPESVSSFEVGYKGVINRKLFIDVYGYYSIYQDFLGKVALVQSRTGQQSGVFNPLPISSLPVSYTQNSTQDIKALGWGASIEYSLTRNFVVYGNVFSDELRDVPEGFVTFFNAPKYRVNLGLRNENLFKGIGFNIIGKWQDENFYEGTFVAGTLPAFLWVDAQVSYKLPKTKSTFKIGGTNIGNNYKRQGYGSPYVGGLYYVSYGYNL